MTDDNTTNTVRTRDNTRPQSFSLVPDAASRATLAQELGISGIRKLTFHGEIAPENATDLKLTADLGATVIQPCVVTLEPVVTRIDDRISRFYVEDLPELPEGAEIEMPEDDTTERLPREIDLAGVMAEALALALPAWPRAEGVDPVELSVTEPGKDPITDEDIKPFGALKSLRDKLDDDGNDNG